MFQLQSRKKVYIGDAPTPWNLDGEWRVKSKECREYYKDDQASAADREREVRLVDTKTQPARGMYWDKVTKEWSQPRE